MASPIILPRQGQSVETCLILTWNKQPGDTVALGDVVCEVETDKATFQVEADAAGVMLAHFYAEGDDVPVLANLCAVGEAGENADALRPDGAAAPAAPAADAAPATPAAAPAAPAAEAAPAAAAPVAVVADGAISPRARSLAAAKGVSVAGLAGTGPGGRIIERDVDALIASGAPLTPAAIAAGGTVGTAGTGIGGRVTTADLAAAAAPAAAPVAAVAAPDAVTEIPVKGIRKLIADRMLQSLQTTAQLTLNSSADARAIQAYRARLKASPEEMGLQKVSLNDMILLVVARTLPDFPELNATFDGSTIRQYAASHLAFAVDTPRGLMVPVIRHAEALSLKQVSSATKSMAAACLKGGITPDELQGGTFTVSNLGAFGISTFTPVINLPQVAILGVGGIDLKPIQGTDGVEFIPHLALSLTIDHRIVDGAPAARFLQAIATGLANIDLLLAQ